MSSISADERLRDVMCSLFGESCRDPFRAELSMNDVARWDSLSHVELVLAIEQEFGVRFSLDESVQATSVGRLLELIGRDA